MRVQWVSSRERRIALCKRSLIKQSITKNNGCLEVGHPPSIASLKFVVLAQRRPLTVQFLSSLRHEPRAQSQGRHTIDRLEERGVARGISWWSSRTGGKGASSVRPLLELFKGNTGKRLRDRLKRRYHPALNFHTRLRCVPFPTGTWFFWKSSWNVYFPDWCNITVLLRAQKEKQSTLTERAHSAWGRKDDVKQTLQNT